MSRFNYAKEKAGFDRKWAILENEYRAAGMPEEDIQAMHDYTVVSKPAASDRPIPLSSLILNPLALASR